VALDKSEGYWKFHRGYPMEERQPRSAPKNGAKILLVIRLGNARTSRLTLKYFWNKNAPDRYGKALGNLPDT
jgi:hypothetical protein